MPASETSATTSPGAHPLEQLARARAFVVLVEAHRAARSIPWRSSSTCVWRVSSQATTSASASAASTRSVTSSRLPIGVGTHDQPPDWRVRGGHPANIGSACRCRPPPDAPNATSHRSTPATAPGAGCCLAAARTRTGSSRRSPPARRSAAGSGGAGASRGKRVVLGLLALVVGWVLLSLLLFLISSHFERVSPPSDVASVLDPAGYPLTSANTILVLGSDRRQKNSKEPGAETTGPGRSDTIMLIRTGGGHAARLSIPRDTVVEIPGHGLQKINAAHAFGGPASRSR